MAQAPDSKPGFYYVTMRDDSNRVALLAGPFENDHAKALEMVPGAQREAIEIHPYYHFNSFGTSRSDSNLGPGKLNSELGLSK